MTSEFEGRISKLPAQHQHALRWFHDRSGQSIGWPEPLPDGTLLLCRPKGIYKPQWSQYALSVRQSLDSPYADQDPIIDDQGRWLYRYFQESKDATARDAEYTNRGLMACLQDGVPVGVVIQMARKPSPRYEVLGTGLVEAWEQGYFPIRQLR